MTSSLIWSVLCALCLPYVMAVVAKIKGGFVLTDNAHPRKFLARLEDAPARAHGASQNSFEGLPIFVAGVCLALFAGVDVSVVASLAWCYVCVMCYFGSGFALRMLSIGQPCALSCG